MKLTKRERILLLGALIIAVGIMFFNYIYFPLKEDIKELKTQSEELSIQINEVKQKQALVETLEEQLFKLQEDSDTIYEDVLKTWDEPEILVYIEETLGELGMSELIENYGVITSEGYLNGDINLNMVATYENLMTILSKFEKGKYFNTVEFMTVEVKDDMIVGAGMKQLKINLALRFYALDHLNEYTEDYHFMKGKFGKNIIFQ